MKRGIIFPESHDKNCKDAFEFGFARGRTAALGMNQERFPLRLLPWPEKMAYHRGYEQAYKRVRRNVRPELRRHRNGT